MPPYPSQPRRVEAKIVCDPLTRALKWELRPNSLADALWLQLGQKLTAGFQIRQCEHCGDWFEAGQGTGRRLMPSSALTNTVFFTTASSEAGGNEDAPDRPRSPALTGIVEVALQLRPGKRRTATTTAA